jgi:aminopeptidase N
VAEGGGPEGGAPAGDRGPGPDRPSRTERAVVGLVVAVAVTALITALVVAGTDDDAGEPRRPSTTAAEPASPPIDGAPGAAGAGDPYYPGLGNGGYDVQHYDLALAWDPDASERPLAAVATITAVATQDLSSFNLDLSGLVVDRATVDGAAARTAREGRELVVSPAAAIAEGDEFVVGIAYGGRPEPIDEATDVFDLGWHTDGAEAYVVSEPSGAASFFPANDHPSDKATFTIAVETSAGQTAVANGVSTGAPEAEPGGRRTWTYEMADPMATYLVQVAVGDLELVDAGTFEGVRIRHALHRSFLEQALATVARTPEMLDVLDDVWGPYPFAAYGVLAVDEPLGFALETQTLSIVGSDLGTAGAAAEPILVHELAHQWVGNAVSPWTWKDIWLNEGMATYSEWLWEERTGGRSAAERARGRFSSDVVRPPADPGPDELFSPTVYERGALTLQALREAVGDDAFFEILRGWVREHSGRSASTADFVALAERTSGRALDALFQRWLYEPGLPSLDR